MKKQTAKQWADDKYDYRVINHKLVRVSDKRLEKFLYYWYLRLVWDTHLFFVRKMERLTRFKKGDQTYKNFK